ncbi:protein mono-ADP-ribosyltransferase PARP4-like isoform X2 [Alosa pseudoharengus]
MRSSSPSSVGKYRALGCSIESLPPQSPDYQTATQLLQHHDKQGEIKIHHVFHVRRGAELQMFREELGNIKPLLHSTSPASFVGILSRGLLLPRVGVEHHGVQRTDVGHLGGGIYFSDSFSTSVKYSRPGVTDGSRLLLVCEVALGYCREFRKKDTTLTSAPEGYDSVHGVRSTPRQHSEFEDDEYVVFSPDQVRLKYVIQYTLPDDQLKDFQPSVDTSVENIPPAGTSDTLGSEDSGGFEDVKNPLDSVTAGLLDSAGQTLPLQAVHVKCKLVDLLSQVIIFQTYSNPNPTPIEAKYVFPLEESAAVCGFEAFINGKHVIGEVKEKEQARKEYKQAIEKGHGAYLMDQEAPDVFTISVGNLPPGATVLIKVTFISELLVKADSIFFQLPGSVAPWQQSAALNERTQGTVEKVCVGELSGVFSLSLSIEMPYEIINLRCDTHRIQTKRTDCKAVVSTLPGETLGSDGFHLYITLSEMHMPRMWVENHPDKDSQACMLVFYPDFGALHGAGEEPSSGPAGPGGRGVQEVLLLLDCSESMRGETLLNARHIALHLLSKLDKKLKINIVLFGTDHKDAFMFSKVLGDAYEPAKKFIKTSPPVGGSTELWRPLRSLSLLPPSRGSRSLVLLSDGHVQNPTLTLQLVRNNAAHTRLFTCGLSKTANGHMLRALAQAGGGAYEFFDTKTRHTWSEKVASQVRRLASPGCSSVAVKWQLFSPTAPPPVQAPAQVHALFSNCHTLVYGFVPHCTQATLYGELCGQEIKTMVSTTELQKTKGTFLHKLTARAVIRDYEDGILHLDEAEHEGKKAQMKSFIVELSKEFSVLSQFTSFVAIEERDAQKSDEGFTDIPKLIAEEDVDLLPYMGWEDEEAVTLKESGIDGDYEDAQKPDEGFTDIPKLIAEEDVDLLPYMGWEDEEAATLKEEEEDLGYLYDDGSLSSVEEDVLVALQGSVFDVEEQSHSILGSGLFNAEKIHGDALCMDIFAAELVPLSEPEPFEEDLGELISLESKLDVDLMNLNEIESCTRPPPPPPVFEGLICRSSSQRSGIRALSMSSGPAPPLPRAFRSCFPPGAFRSCFLPPPGAFTTAVQGSAGFTVSGTPIFAPTMLSHSSQLSSHIPKRKGKRGEGEMEAAPLASGEHSSVARPSAQAPDHPPVSVPSPTRQGSVQMFDHPPVSVPSPTPVPTRQGSVQMFGRAPFSSPAPMSSPIPERKKKIKAVPYACGENSAIQRLSAQAPDTVHLAPVCAPTPSPAPSGVASRRLASEARSVDVTRSTLPPPVDRASKRVSKGYEAPRPQTYRHLSAAALDSFSLPLGGRAVSSTQSASDRPPAASDVMSAPLPPLPLRERCPLPPLPLRERCPLPAPVVYGAAYSAPPVTVGDGDDSDYIGILEGSSPVYKAQALALDHPPAPSPLLPPPVACGPQPVLAQRHRSAALGSPLRRTKGLAYPSNMVLEKGSGMSVPLLPPVEAQEHGSSFTPGPRQSRVQKRCSLRRKGAGLRSHFEIKPSASWEQLACLQRPEGYWECTEEVGLLLGVDLNFFANVFLKEKGISSLGPKAQADILRLVSTLLVLQLVRVRKLVQGELLQSLFRLRDPPQHSSSEWEALKRAVDWVRWADRQYPCVCSRLEFGRDWESSTRQLLGFDRPHPLSPLNPLLERSRTILAC